METIENDITDPLSISDVENDQNIFLENSQYQLYKNEVAMFPRNTSQTEGNPSMESLREVEKEMKVQLFGDAISVGDNKNPSNSSECLKLSQATLNVDPNMDLKSAMFAVSDEFILQTLEINSEQLGTPTTIVESEQFVAIGTSKSIVCVFDKQQQDETFSKAEKEKPTESGAVTALAITFDQLFLAVGFENGDINILELKNNLQKLTYWKKILKGQIKVIEFISNQISSLKEFAFLAFDSLGQNIRIEVDVTIVFGSKITTSNKDKLLIDYQTNVRSESTKELDSKELSQDQSRSKSTTQSLSIVPPILLFYDIKCLSQGSFTTLPYKSIIAMACEDSVYIAGVSAKAIQVLFSFKEPCERTVHPSISWGYGHHATSMGNAVLLCCVSWQEKIFLISMESGIYGIKTVGSTRFEQNIQVAQFISQSLILVIFSNNQTALIHTSTFQGENQQPRLASSLHLDHLPQFQSLAGIQDSPEKQNHLLYCFRQNTVLIFIPQTLLFSFTINKWQQYFEALSTKDVVNWDYILLQALLFQRNKIKYLAGVENNKEKRTEEIKKNFQTLGLTFIQHNFIIDNELDPERIKQILTLGIEFLLESDNWEFLFDVAYLGISKFGYQQQFLEVLSVFIQNGMLRNVPDQFIKIIDSYLSGQNRYDLLQKFILHLDLTESDISPFLVTCTTYNLFNPLIYICTNSGDFLTPLMKLLPKYETIKKVQQKKFGQKILWYIHTSFMGKKIDGSRISDKIFPFMLRNLILFIFQAENLQSILNIDRKIVLDIFLILFLPHLQEVISENHSIFRIECDDDLIKKYAFFDEANMKPQYVPYQRILTVLTSQYEAEKAKMSKEKPQEIQELDYLQKLFLSRVMEQQQHLPFSVSFQIQLLNFITDNPDIFVYFENKQSKSKSNVLLEQGVNIPKIEKINQNILLRNAFIINILRQVLQQESDKTILASLAQRLELANFTEAACFIYNYLHNHTKCFKLYDESSNPLIRARIFPWLEQVFDSPFWPVSAINELKETFLTKIKVLVQIDQHQTKGFIMKYFDGKQNDILHQLSAFPNEQLSILEEMINDDEKISDELKEMHIKLLCSLRPNDVLINLEMRLYPQDKVLSYCVEYGILDGQVFLHQQNGVYSKALSIQILVIQGFWDDVLDIADRDHFQEINPEITKKLLDSLQKGIKICIQDQKQSNSSSLWFELFNQVAFYMVKLQTLTKHPSVYLQQISTQLISDLIEGMSNNSLLNEVLRRLSGEYGKIPLKAFLKTNEHFRDEFEFLTAAHTSVKLILQNSMMANQTSYVALKSKGLSSTQLPQYSVCLLCEKQIDSKESKIYGETDLLLFYCSHSFHRKCIEECVQPNVCPICFENPTIYVRNYYNPSKNLTKTAAAKTRKSSNNQTDGEGLEEDSVLQGQQNGWKTQIKPSAESPKKKAQPQDQQKKKRLNKLLLFDSEQNQKKKIIQEYRLSVQNS